MVIRLMLIMATLFSFAASALTQLSATVDKNPVMVNESFILTITADAKLSGNALNLDVLSGDFIVNRAGTSSQTNIDNGNIQHSTSWTILLLARNEGTYTIPSFTIGNVSSQPISVEVIPAGQTQTAGQHQEVFLETTVDKQTAYLQSAIIYTSKLYLALDFQRGSLTEPKMENANITQLSNQQDEESSEIKNGVRYRVITRVYSITPQRSGKYKITPPLFNGELVVKRRRSFFSGFNNTKPVSVLGQEIDIEILPIPQNYAGAWLPSEMVVLAEEWQPTGGQYRVGDPITRVITLSAIGVNEEQLPEIEASYPASVKTYPDQSNLYSTTRNNKLVAQRKDSIAIVPGKSGDLTLPEVKIPWFNTIKNQIEYAILPAKVINVAPTLDSDRTPVAQPQTALERPSERPAEVQYEIKEVPVAGWMTWSFLSAWLLTLILWVLHVRHLKNNSQPAAAKSASKGATSGKTYWTLFEKACKSGDAKTASNELLRWGRARWPEQSFSAPMDVALFLNADEVINGVKIMQQSLYGASGGTWQGQSLLKAVSQNKEPKKSQSAETLNPLHPA